MFRSLIFSRVKKKKEKNQKLEWGRRLLRRNAADAQTTKVLEGFHSQRVKREENDSMKKKTGGALLFV